jgi:hypothetical protein
MGPAIDVFFNISGGRCQTHRRCPPGSHHRRLLQHWWWPLLDPLAAPPRGLPSTSSSTLVVDTAGPADSALGGQPLMCSSTLVVAASGPTDSAPRWPAIDVFFNIGGGCRQTHRQCPPRGCHRHLLQHRWWTLPNPPAAPLGGPAIDVFFNLDVLQQVVAIASIYYQHLPGATVVNYH